jgi:zinc transport system permease protein
MLSLAVVVAVAIKVVGVLLIGALLLIPAAAASSFTASPERMALCAAGLGVASALLGLQASFVLDTPTGPTIVCTGAVFFAGSSVLAVLRRAL